MRNPRRAWLLFLGLAIALGTALALNLAWQLHRVPELIRQSLERHPGVRVAVGGVRLAWPPGRVALDNVTVSGRGPGFIAWTPRLTLTVNPLSLVQRSIRVSHASADGARFTVALDRLNEVREILLPPDGAARGRGPGKPASRRWGTVVLPSALSLTSGSLRLETRSGPWHLGGINGVLTRRGSALRLVLTHAGGSRLAAEVLPGAGGAAEITLAMNVASMAQLPKERRGTVAGNLSGSLRFAGQEVTGNFRLSAGQVEWPGFPPITDLTGKLRLFPAFVELEEFRFRAGGESQVAGHARLRLRPPLRLTFRAVAPLLDLTPWVGSPRVLPGAPKEPAPGVISGAHAATPHSAQSWLGRQLSLLRVDGRVAVARGQIGALRFTGARAHVLASEGQWVVQAVRLALDGGEQRGYLKFSFPERSGEAFLAADRVPLDTVYTFFFSGTRFPGGRASYSALLRWRGLTWPELRQSLSGRGMLRVEDGRLPVTLGAGGAPRDVRFSELTSGFRVSAGKIVTDNLEIRGEPWALLRGGGQIDLTGKLALRVASPPEVHPGVQGLITGDVSRPRLGIVRVPF